MIPGKSSLSTRSDLRDTFESGRYCNCANLVVMRGYPILELPAKGMAPIKAIPESSLVEQCVRQIPKTTKNALHMGIRRKDGNRTW